MNNAHLTEREQLELAYREARRTYRNSLKIWNAIPASDAKQFFFLELQEQKRQIKEIEAKLFPLCKITRQV